MQLCEGCDVQVPRQGHEHRVLCWVIAHRVFVLWRGGVMEDSGEVVSPLTMSWPEPEILNMYRRGHKIEQRGRVQSRYK